MLGSLASYGPHGSITAQDGPVAVGRALYRLLPEDRFDLAPQRSADGRFLLVADARIDNREALADRLALSGGDAARLCDAAFILRAWQRWGEDCVDHLTGDYAFALWDTECHRFVLARDFLGKRPLYFHRSEALFAFSSMPRGLHALDAVPRHPDEERAAEFLMLLPNAGTTRSFFEKVESLPSGHIATIDRNDVAMRRYWRPTRRDLGLRNTDDYTEALREQLDRAVRRQLRSTADGIGSELSAGLDSSAVTTAAALILAERGARLTAFTAVPPTGFAGTVPTDRLADEGPIAAATAALHANIDHVRLNDSHTPFDCIERFYAWADEPVLNPTAGWFLALLDAARSRGVKLLLGATMGNLSTSFSGVTAPAELAAAGRWGTLFRLGSALARSGDRPWYWTLALAGRAGLGPRVAAAIDRLCRSRYMAFEEYSALNPARLSADEIKYRASERGLDTRYRPRLDGFETRVWGLQRTDPGSFVKSMLGGWGIDRRDPTADRELVEFCLSIPSEAHIVDGRLRGLARRTFGGRFPPELLAERRRGLQGADWTERMTAVRGEITAELDSLEELPLAARVIDLPRLRRLEREWKINPADRMSRDGYQLALMRALSLGHFLRRTSGANS